MKYPFALTEANLKTAMTDPRYTNSRHPESQSWHDMVSQGFAILYPDQTLRGDHTDALSRFQGADGHIYASDGTKVASGRQSTVRTMEWRNGVDQDIATPLPYRPDSGGENAVAMVAANEGGGDGGNGGGEGGGGGGGGYNPDQPRDWHGRWTSEGGGEGGGGSNAPPPEGNPKEPPAPPTPAFDRDKFGDTLNEKAGEKPGNKCATRVREALEAGGLDTTGHPRDAKDWGPTLEKNGFTPADEKAYRPEKGDVAVIQPYPGGNESGHIAAYDGKQWISDFKQRDMWGGQGYRTQQPPHVIYRRGN